MSFLFFRKSTTTTTAVECAPKAKVKHAVITVLDAYCSNGIQPTIKTVEIDTDDVFKVISLMRIEGEKACCAKYPRVRVIGKIGDMSMTPYIVTR